MNTNKKPPGQTTIIEALRRGQLTLPPLSFELLESEPLIAGRYRPDALVMAHWGESSITFIVEIKGLSTPQAFAAGIAVLKTATLPKNRPPLLITPFLSESQLQELEREGINGLDLCGNGTINVPPKLTVFRSGKPNRFPSYGPIKNIYRKNSSLVGRLLFSFPNPPSVMRIVEEISRRDILSPAMGLPSLSIGTVSKALSRMEEDLIIERKPNGIALLQPDALLDKLSRNYVNPAGIAVSLKVNASGKDLYQILSRAATQIKAPIVATGLFSVSRYAVMQREEKLLIYCPRTDALLEQLAPTSSATDRFPNLEIFDTQEAPSYFDAREENDFFWASPIQTYLELMAGDKRDQETADQVRSFLLNSVKEKRP
jgi:hypothetical protein